MFVRIPKMSDRLSEDILYIPLAVHYRNLFTDTEENQINSGSHKTLINRTLKIYLSKFSKRKKYTFV